jgi:hypothetical protein
MKSIVHLMVVSNFLEEKLKIYAETGEYGGKGKFELPDSHKAAIQVPKGGSCCQNCRFVDAQNHACKNTYYIQWNGGDDKLPDLPLDEICSDWWESSN